MTTDIVVKVLKTDLEFATPLESDPALQATKLSGAGISGGSEYLVFLVPLASFTAKALIDLIKANWAKASHVKVEFNGMSFSGASLDEISDFIDKQLRKK